MSITVREPNGSRTVYEDEMVERIIDGCRTELAINFDCPAPQILRVYAAKLGISVDRLKDLLGKNL